jgi:acyl-CoA synthetase (NDP forming)
VSKGKSIAIVGASESTLWTYWLMRNLREYEFAGDIWPVNPNRESVYGTACYPSLDVLPGVPEAGAIITSAARAVGAARDLIEAGTRRLLVVSDGFRETATEEGLDREGALRELAENSGVEIVGPNCVGMASFHESFCAIAEPIPLDLQPGGVSVVSQSGVLTATALAALRDENLGIDVCYSLGNGASFPLARALASVAARPTTKVVCAVVESIGDREVLADAVAGGRAAGVEFVFLLLGQSEDGKRVAQSHTGAVVGDQRIVRAWLNSLDVILADSFEELTRSAALLSTVGRPGPDRGVFILTNSGGGAGLAADTAARCGLSLAQLSEGTAAELRKHVLPGTVIGNPLDVTTHGGEESARAIYDLVAADPAVGILLDPYGMSWPDNSDERRWHRAGFNRMVAAAEASGIPLIITSLAGQPETDYIQGFRDAGLVEINTGLTATLSSLAKLYVRHGDIPDGSASAANHVDADSVIDEARARGVLSEAGFRVVRGSHANSPGQAGSACADLRAPWVAKVSLPGLGHKGRVGGVRLGICSPQELERECEDIAAKVAEFGLAQADDISFLIQEMEFGPELLIGAVRDRVVGPSVIVGVGGWAAETGTVFAAIPLPASRDAMADYIGRSALPRLIGASQTGRVLDLLEDIGTAFTEGSLSGYSVVECNPVIVGTNGPVIADALLIK